MSFLESISGSRQDPVVVKHEFLLSFNPKQPIIHAFFESLSDQSFYGPHIRRLKPEAWALKTYDCRNKKGVIYLFAQLQGMHSYCQPMLFFVDKDLDNLIPIAAMSGPNLYVTDFYAIENYVVTSRVLGEYWSDLCRQSAGNAAAIELEETFQKALASAHDILLDVMTWVLLHRRNGDRPDLNNVSIKSIVTVDDDLSVRSLLERPQLMAYLEESTGVQAPTALMDRFDATRSELDGYHPKEVIRGHYEMSFLLLFIAKLVDLLQIKTKGKVRPRLQLSESNVLDVLGPRVPIPSSLEVFLGRHLPADGILAGA